MGRLQSYALFLSGFRFDIQYVKSHENSANALSCLALNVKHHEPDEFAWCGMFYTAKWKAPIDCQQVKIETQKDNVLWKVYGFIMFSWSNCLSQE